MSHQAPSNFPPTIKVDIKGTKDKAMVTADCFIFAINQQPRTPDLPTVDMFLQAHSLHRVEIKHELMISQLGPSYSNSNEEVYDIEINFHDMDSIMRFLS